MNGLMRARGFTLLEVLIALLIVAITLSAATAAVGGAARRQRGLEERTFATWAAQNALSRLRLDGFAGDAMQSEQSIAGQVWQVQVKTRAEGPLRRVDLAVRHAAEAEPLARLTGYLPVQEHDSGPAKQSAPQASPDSLSDPQAQDRPASAQPSPPEQEP